MFIWWLRIFHTTPEKFEITALSLQKCLPSTRKLNGASQKTLFKRGNWNRRRGVLLWMENILEIDFFGNDDVILIMRVFLKRKSNMTGDCFVFKFIRRSVDGKHLMHFQSENTVCKFLRRSVDRASENLILQCFYLTIRLWAGDFYEVIVDEAEGRINYRLIEIESE